MKKNNKQKEFSITEHLRRNSMYNHNKDNKNIVQVLLVLVKHCDSYYSNRLSTIVVHRIVIIMFHHHRMYRIEIVECNHWNWHCIDDVFDVYEMSNHLWWWWWCVRFFFLNQTNKQLLSYLDIYINDCIINIDNSYRVYEQLCVI